MWPLRGMNGARDAIHRACGPQGCVTNLAWEKGGRKENQERRKQRVFQAEGTAEAKAQRKDIAWHGLVAPVTHFWKVMLGSVMKTEQKHLIYPTINRESVKDFDQR